MAWSEVPSEFKGKLEVQQLTRSLKEWRQEPGVLSLHPAIFVLCDASSGLKPRENSILENLSWSSFILEVTFLGTLGVKIIRADS